MDYRKFSDTELVNLFLARKPDQEAIRDEMFGRYYGRFDQRIRAVLHTRGLPYSPAEFYYSEIFTDMYRQVFDLSEFEKILGKYQTGRGGFANWFINYVVVNRVKDWLKKVDKSTGLSNLERLKEALDLETRRLSLDDSAEEREDELTLAEMMSAGTGASDRAEPRDIESAIQQLPPNLRITLRLFFLAYGDIPEGELAHLAAEIQSPVEVIEDRVEQVRRELQESPKYEEAEQVELTLACMFQQEEHWQWGIKQVESEIEGLFPGQEIPQIAEQELEQAHQQRQIGPKEHYWQSLCLQHQQLTKQLSKSAQKRARLLQEYNSGKYFVLPSYRQLAQLLNTSEGAVGNRVNRIVNRLNELLQMKEIEPRFRINKVEAKHERSDDYAE